MSADDYVILEWSYTPANFFEEAVYVRRDDYEIRIEDGKATATVDPDYYDAEHKKRDKLHEVVEAYFRAVQVVAHKTFNLPQAWKMSGPMPDGRRHVVTFAPAIRVKIALHAPDTRITDANGTVVVDTRRERIDKELALAESVGRLRPRDSLLGKLLDSYQTAVDDPDDELVHLYEIREAIQKHFGGERKAKVTLGLTDSQWKPLGRLACDEPVKQGRHRGAHLAPLRKATAEELVEAREIARGLIEAYVRWAEALGAEAGGG